ncbi:MAG: 3-deoxy-D-manno-octulosonic acid transferase [Chitinophagales bacterium]|nr:3-deoxy-D-manno-octulosonic acid transferase [Chitinophagales bacterium]
MLSILGHSKARKWLKGREETMQFLSSGPIKDEMIWFHCASLGEFEQGRPVLEKLKEEYPQYKILLTFFSPSGYEVRKDYSGADHVLYLPNDTAAYAKIFHDHFNIKLGIFVKYDLWYHILKEAKTRGVELLLISALFRKDHIYFSWFGGLHREMLRCFKEIFVQNRKSLDLLHIHEFKNSRIAFDTRFDRVLQIAYNRKADEKTEVFKSNYKCIVAGSTWPEDENILIPWILDHPEWRLVLAPHEMDESHLKSIEKKCKGASIRHSEGVFDLKHRVMIIDNFGMLSSLYYYSDVAYVGGGFGVSVHNILEAAVFESPVIFGPHHEKSIEASELIKLRGGFEIREAKEFRALMERFEEEAERKKYGVIAEDYVIERKGGSEVILRYIREELIR